MCRDAFMRVARLIHACDLTRLYACDMTHSCIHVCTYVHYVGAQQRCTIWATSRSSVLQRCIMRHATYMNESCHTHERVMSHVIMSHTQMSHVTHTNESCHTHKRVTSHDMKMRHKSRKISHESRKFATALHRMSHDLRYCAVALQNMGHEMR